MHANIGIGYHKRRKVGGEPLVVYESGGGGGGGGAISEGGTPPFLSLWVHRRIGKYNHTASHCPAVTYSFTPSKYVLLSCLVD